MYGRFLYQFNLFLYNGKQKLKYLNAKATFSNITLSSAISDAQIGDLRCVIFFLSFMFLILFLILFIYLLFCTWYSNIFNAYVLGYRGVLCFRCLKGNLFVVSFLIKRVSTFLFTLFVKQHNYATFACLNVWTLNKR